MPCVIIYTHTHVYRFFGHIQAGSPFFAIMKSFSDVRCCRHTGHLFRSALNLSEVQLTQLRHCLHTNPSSQLIHLTQLIQLMQLPSHKVNWINWLQPGQLGNPVQLGQLGPQILLAPCADALKKQIELPEPWKWNKRLKRTNNSEENHQGFTSALFGRFDSGSSGEGSEPLKELRDDCCLSEYVKQPAV